MREPIHLPALLSDIAGVSRSRARRAIASGAVKVNGKPWLDLDLPADAVEPNGYIEHPFRHEVIERQRRGEL
jgi:16S rRNA U516 pseudouridylate synthase RsuA-like enzyme